MVQSILLIDDDPIVNLIHSKIMENEFPGTPRMIFTNGLQALEYILKNSKIPFLVFLDINMPTMNGWQFLDALSRQKDNFDLQIHILTSSINQNDREKAKRYKKVHSFIHKPLTRMQLTNIKKELTRS